MEKRRGVTDYDLVSRESMQKAVNGLYIATELLKKYFEEKEKEAQAAPTKQPEPAPKRRGRPRKQAEDKSK